MASEVMEAKRKVRSSVGKKAVNHVRSVPLGLCTLFSLSKEDSADIISCVEAIDSTFSKQVSVFQFCDSFCPKWKHCFTFLFAKYQQLPLFQTHSAHKEAAPGFKGPSSSSQHNLVASYAHILGFLFLMAPLDPREVSNFLFLLSFEHIKYRPKCEHLTQLASELWGNTDEGKKAVGTVKFVSRSVDIEIFDVLKLEAYDQQSKNGFTGPIVKLVAELRKNMCDKLFWDRITVEISVLKSDFNGYALRLGRIRSMLDASEECHFIDSTKPYQKKSDQVDCFAACFEYVHKVENSSYKSIKGSSDKIAGQSSTFGGRVAEVPAKLYKLLFGGKSLDSLHRHQHIVPFRPQVSQYNVKGFSADDLFVFAEDAVILSEDCIEAADTTLTRGKQADIEINRTLKKMKKSAATSTKESISGKSHQSAKYQPHKNDEEDDDGALDEDEEAHENEERGSDGNGDEDKEALENEEGGDNEDAVYAYDNNHNNSTLAPLQQRVEDFYNLEPGEPSLDDISQDEDEEAEDDNAAPPS